MTAIVIMLREMSERPEMKQKENTEGRTFRAAPEEGAWDRTAGEWLPASQAPPAGHTAAEHDLVPNTEYYKLPKPEEESQYQEGRFHRLFVTCWDKDGRVLAQEEILFDPYTAAYPNSTGDIGLCVNFKLHPPSHVGVAAPGQCIRSAGQTSPRDEPHRAPRSAQHAEYKKNSSLRRQESDC